EGRKRSLVDDRDVLHAVAVDVRHRDRLGAHAHGETDRGQKTGDSTVFQRLQGWRVPARSPVSGRATAARGRWTLVIHDSVPPTTNDHAVAPEKEHTVH